ncbi:LuxR C-terminal-related transcriptional regulator [Streptomyces sp. NPDC006649]|uniref:helix-turn-helix transcriptional regulator n=1 Tax=Streptomyces sp. NPDC006649 TaxID=3156896 RepID=UPI0033AEEEE2
MARVQSVTVLSLLPALEEALAAGVIGSTSDRFMFLSPGLSHRLRTEIPAPVRQALLRGVPVPRPREHVMGAGGAGADIEAEPGRESGPVARATAQTPDSLVSALLLSQDNPGRPLDPRSEAAMRRTLVRTPGSPGDTADGGTDGALILSLFGHKETEQRDRARAIATKRGQGASSVVAALILSNLEWAAGHVDQALEWGDQAQRMDHTALPVSWRPYPSLALADKLAHLGRFAEGETELTHTRELAERLDHPWARAESAIVRGRLLAGMGRTEEAEAEVRTGVALALRVSAHLPASQGLSLLSLLSLARGRWSEAADQIGRARSQLDLQPGTLPPVRHSWADFRVTTTDMDASGALGLFAKRFPDLLAKPSLFLLNPEVSARLVRLGLAAGEYGLAAAVTRQVTRLADQNPGQAGLAATARHAWALLHQDPDALEHAALQHVAPWASAAASEDLGGMLLKRREHRHTARRHLRTARERYHAIGALVSAARVESLLQDAGEDSPRHVGVSQPPASGREQRRSRARSVLTEAEHRIACLVAEGLTNQQVAKRVSRSPHTVNYHLRQIFRKLDVDSRVKLARILHP